MAMSFLSPTRPNERSVRRLVLSHSICGSHIRETMPLKSVLRCQLLFFFFFGTVPECQVICSARGVVTEM